MEERDEDRTSDENRPEEAAAKPGEQKQDPGQDDTESDTFDSEEHSDAPGPFGTG